MPGLGALATRPRMAYANPDGGNGLRKLLEILGLLKEGAVNTVNTAVTNPLVQSIASKPVATFIGQNPDVSRVLRRGTAKFLQNNPFNPMTKEAAFTAVNQPAFKNAVRYAPAALTATAAAPLVVAAMPSQTEEEKFLEYLMQNGGMI